jgi:hypothetical protein
MMTIGDVLAFKTRTVSPSGVDRQRTGPRSLYTIAREIRQNWPKVYFGAVPYLNAMGTLDSIHDTYGCDSARSVVAYFLANAATWRGPAAKAIKVELNAMLKGGR